MHAALAARRPLGKSRVRVRDLYERSVVLPLAQGAVHVASYAGLAWIATVPAWQPFSFALWPWMGLLLTGFLAAAHDCAHGSLLDTKRANRVAGAAWCTPLLFNFTVFKVAHFQHHRFTRVPGDTEPLEPMRSLGDYAQRVLYQNPFASMRSAARIALGAFPSYLDSNAKRSAARVDAIVVVLWLLLAFSLTALEPRWMLAVYWGPFLFLAPMVSLTALPEHYGCGTGPDVLPSTRSVTSNFFVRTILWNGNFHAEHHLYPAVPSCNLPELSRRLAEAPVLRAKSYLGFHLTLLRELSRTPAKSEEP